MHEAALFTIQLNWGGVTTVDSVIEALRPRPAPAESETDDEAMERQAVSP